MSEQNVELHRRVIDLFNARDIDEFITYFDPQIEFHSVSAAVGGGVYRGQDGLLKDIEDTMDAWGDEFSSEPEAFFDLGEKTLLFHVVHGRGRESGAEVAMPAAQLCIWRNGLCVYFKAYPQREDALRDLGVSQDELEPIVP